MAALSVVLIAFYYPVQALALATNRTDVIFRLNLAEACSRIVLVSLGVYFYSLMGVVAARLAMSVIWFVLSLLTARHLVGTKLTSEIGNLWKVAAACAAMAILDLILRHELAGTALNMTIELIFTAAFGGLVYVTTLFALGVRFRNFLEVG
jgi:PST family polysaccharide transporter